MFYPCLQSPVFESDQAGGVSKKVAHGFRILALESGGVGLTSSNEPCAVGC